MLENRERIEWLNYWIEDANKNKERILLIGDSVTRQYRSIMNTLANYQGYSVDVLAVSYNMLDEAVEEEIKHYLETVIYKYTYIVFQLGAHHGHWIQCSDNEKHKKWYRENIEKICNLLQKYCTKLVIASGTPEREKEIGSSSKSNNIEIEARNKIVKDVADQKELLYVDLYWKVKERNFELKDRFHFTFQAYEFIAITLLNEMLHIKFPEIAHRISHMIELKEYIEKYPNGKLYIYGNGCRGKNLYKYLEKKGYKPAGFVVSEEYFVGLEDDENIWSIEMIVKDKDAFLIVTPNEYSLWRSLYERKMEYITIDESLYGYIDETIILENM